MLFLAASLMGVSQILFFASFTSLQTDYVPTEKRGKIFGSSNFVNNFVAALAQLAGGIMYEISPQLPFLLIIPISLMGFIMTVLLVSEPKQRQK
jgi:MFS family permease